ncbi:hypothetical protein AM587_10008597 [Phytophthora nicotianae]|uniref:Uncharacterized protein n=1 Tax=Phytophthora nicotianae TaxID=4792 RepID=A0A0W8C7H8_PHYNI|nr:hypothetical protein AM587_10008597 [Phytophthora nicotianae]
MYNWFNQFHFSRAVKNTARDFSDAGEVLTRLKCGISRRHQEDLANSVPGAIELLLIQVKKTV